MKFRIALALLWRLALVVIVVLSTQTQSVAGIVTSTTIFNLPVYGIRTDPVRNILYASVPSRASVGLRDTITRIDLNSKTVLDSTFIGSQPEAFAISSDGSQMYVDLAGSFKIRSLNLNTMTPGPETSVANNYSIGDLAVVPTHANTFVGSILRSGSPKYVGIGVWHFDGTNFTTNGPVGIGAINLAYSNNPSIFYATSGQSLAEVTLGPGDSLSARYGPDLGATDPGIAFGGNTVVSTHARVIDTVSFANSGHLNFGEFSGGVAVDVAANKIYALRGQNIRVYDKSTLALLDTLNVPQVGTAGAYNLYRYGDHGVAFDTDQDKVFLVESPSIGVPEPSSSLLAAFGLVGLAAWCGRRKRQARLC